jgi:hypothetical protein
VDRISEREKYIKGRFLEIFCDGKLGSHISCGGKEMYEGRGILFVLTGQSIENLE